MTVRILCKFIYPGYITFYTCCNCIPHDKVWQHLYRALGCHCSLHQCDAISRWCWRLMGMLTEFLRLPPLSPSSPLHWWFQLHSPSVSPWWCYSTLGASCSVHRLCSVKDSGEWRRLLTSKPWILHWLETVDSDFFALWWLPGEGHFLCRAVRDARLYMGYFWEIFCTFSARWVPFFNEISVFFLQGGYLFLRKILYLLNKMEPIYKKFSVFYSTKLLHFTHKISVYFYMMSIFSRDLL